MNLPQFILVLIVTAVISALTLMTGFGVGTVLTPTFTLFYDVKTAVFLVAVVHLANNLLKFGLFARHLDKRIFLRFGLLSIAGALVGSLFQGHLPSATVQAFLALFLLASGVSEFLPDRFSTRLPRKFDFLGGLVSGLMGGLIGNQGAIRSAYLLNYDLSKQAFIATATSIAIVIDLSRIPIYIVDQAELLQEAWTALGILTIVAFAGTLIGRRLLESVSLERFRRIVSAFVFLLGAFLLLQLFIS